MAGLRRSFDNLVDNVKDRGIRTIETIQQRFGIDSRDDRTWPQTRPPDSRLKLLYPNHRTKGFLPPTLIPTGDLRSIRRSSSSKVQPGDQEDSIELKGVEGLNVQGTNYKYVDWRGHLLEPQKRAIIESEQEPLNQDTKDKFDKSKNLPKTEKELVDSSYSTRDIYSIFNDNSTDYFKHGLHVIDNLTPIDNDNTSLRLDSYKGTPYEQNDPVIFGFDIIIDDITSPLLNGSVLDFLRNYDNISEISSKKPVYEDFKQQFIKFFKTKSTVSIDTDQTTLSKMRPPSTPEAPTRDNMFQDMGKRAYMNYYLKKVSGLEKLIEQNTPTEKKFLADYNKDIISLSFSEDVTLSVGTLAHLYKLLYWSKPNGKSLVPENLLRFNCEIVISEVRNYKRVIQALEDIDDNSGLSFDQRASGGIGTIPNKVNKQLKIIKDNVSRYVYNLRECQFYFNTLPHNAEVDMGGTPTPFAEGSYNVQFDYKYSTVKLERFVPNLSLFGQAGEYVGYDGGAMWRVGSTRSSDPSIDTSNFFTKGENKFNQNGVNGPFVLDIPNLSVFERDFQSLPEEEKERSLFKRFIDSQTQRAKVAGKVAANSILASVQREAQFFVNDRVAILNRSLNKILDSQGLIGVRPPRNIYTERGTGMETAGGRLFYDVRGQLLNFATGVFSGGGVFGGPSRGF